MQKGQKTVRKKILVFLLTVLAEIHMGNTSKAYLIIL